MMASRYGVHDRITTAGKPVNVRLPASPAHGFRNPLVARSEATPRFAGGAGRWREEGPGRPRSCLDGTAPPDVQRAESLAIRYVCPSTSGGRLPERSEGPLIVQSDRTILLETAHPALRGGARLDCPLRGAGEEPGAHPHVPALAALAVERGGRRARGSAHSRRARRAFEVPGAAKRALRRRGHRRPLREAAAGARRRRPARSRSPTKRGCSRRSRGSRRWSRASTRRSTPARSRSSRACAARSSSADQGRLSGRRPRRLRRRCAARDRASRRHDRRSALPPAPLSRGGGAGSSTPTARTAAVRASSCCRAARARRSSASA